MGNIIMECTKLTMHYRRCCNKYTFVVHRNLALQMLSNCFYNTEMNPLSKSAEAVTSQISKLYCFLKCVASLAHLETLEMNLFLVNISKLYFVSI